MYHLSVQTVLQAEQKSDRTVIFLCLSHCSLTKMLKNVFFTALKKKSFNYLNKIRKHIGIVANQTNEKNETYRKWFNE